MLLEDEDGPAPVAYCLLFAGCRRRLLLTDHRVQEYARVVRRAAVHSYR